MAQFWRGATLPRGRSGVQRLRQSEKSFQAQVVALAKLRGWMTWHAFDSRRSTAGVPDLLLVRVARTDTPAGPTGRVIFAELKTETGVVSAPQRQWLDALAATGKVEAYTWRPSMWTEIDAILA